MLEFETKKHIRRRSTKKIRRFGMPPKEFPEIQVEVTKMTPNYYFMDNFNDFGEDTKEGEPDNFVKFINKKYNEGEIILDNGTFISVGYVEDYQAPAITFYVFKWVDEVFNNHISLIHHESDNDQIIPAFDFKDKNIKRIFYNFYEGYHMNPSQRCVFQGQEWSKLKNGWFRDEFEDEEDSKVVIRNGKLVILRKTGKIEPIGYIDLIDMGDKLLYGNFKEIEEIEDVEDDYGLYHEIDKGGDNSEYEEEVEEEEEEYYEDDRDY